MPVLRNVYEMTALCVPHIAGKNISGVMRPYTQDMNAGRKEKMTIDGGKQAGMGMKKATLADVAQAAEVSPATVSMIPRS